MRRNAAVLMLLAAALALAGCSAPTDTLSDAAGQAGAATAGASIAVDLFARGRSTSPATDTTLSDALRELQQADESATDLEPGDAADDQRAVVAAIRTATDAVVDARQRLTAPAPLAVSGDALRDAADALEALESELSKR